MLSEDITTGNGAEWMIINRLPVAVAPFAVRNFSGEEPLVGSDTEVLGMTDKGQILDVFTAPAPGSGRWWNLLTVNPAGHGVQRDIGKEKGKAVDSGPR